MRDVLGLLVLDALLLGVGTAVLAALGLVRAVDDGLRLGGLALVVGWSCLGVLASYALVLGSSLTVGEVVLGAAVVAAVCAVLARRVAGRPLRSRLRTAGTTQRYAAIAGGVVLVLYLESLFLRARLAEPREWDTWAFWLPKAMSIVHFGGLDTAPGGFTSFANPDYPPLRPAMDAIALRFVGEVDPGALAVQAWLLSAAFFFAVAGLLAHRVRPEILWPSLAVLALLPDVGASIGSQLADETIAVLVALAAVCGALWLLERDVRLALLTALLLAGASLVKNEGLMYALILAALLLVASRARDWRHLLAPALLPVLAIVPWRLWLDASGIPGTPAFRLADLARPGYLLDRTERFTTGLEELVEVLLDVDRWLLVIPVVLIAAVAVAGRRPGLAVYAVGVVAAALVGFAVVYWASPFPLAWYVDTTAERIVGTVVLIGGALFPLLVAETLGNEGYPARERARSSAVRAADS